MDEIKALKEIIKDLCEDINLEEEIREMNKKITFLIDKQDRIRVLEKENKELVKVLKTLEYYRVEKTPSGIVYEVCPICGYREYEGHKPGCVLGNLLEKYKKLEQ
jgi:cell shape-determining protein MreC